VVTIHAFRIGTSWELRNSPALAFVWNCQKKGKIGNSIVTRSKKGISQFVRTFFMCRSLDKSKRGHDSASKSWKMKEAQIYGANKKRRFATSVLVSNWLVSEKVQDLPTELGCQS